MPYHKYQASKLNAKLRLTTARLSFPGGSGAGGAVTAAAGYQPYQPVQHQFSLATPISPQPQVPQVVYIDPTTGAASAFPASQYIQTIDPHQQTQNYVFANQAYTPIFQQQHHHHHISTTSFAQVQPHQHLTGTPSYSQQPQLHAQQQQSTRYTAQQQQQLYQPIMISTVNAQAPPGVLQFTQSATAQQNGHVSTTTQASNSEGQAGSSSNTSPSSTAT